MNVTLDLNCVISIENSEKETSFFLRSLLDKHENGEITIFIPGISGSEKLKSGNYADNFTKFKNRISKLTIRPTCILAPMWSLGISFLDYSILGDKKLIKLDKQIHNILFPRIPYCWEDYVKLQGGDINKLHPKWLNPRCDAISMWCHIHYENDIFISNDGNFFKKEKHEKLIELGAKKIFRPIEAYNYCI